MKIHQIVCDVCGTPKKETNHWFKVNAVPAARFNPDTTPGASPYDTTTSFVVTPSKEFLSGKDICGQECVAKLLSQWMATGSIDSKALQEAVTL